jgi:hypothetical protein
MRPDLSFTSDTLLIRPWPDEVIDALGFDPRSPYVETYWLGILGPSTTWSLYAAAYTTTPCVLTTSRPNRTHSVASRFVGRVSVRSCRAAWAVPLLVRSGQSVRRCFGRRLDY